MSPEFSATLNAVINLLQEKSLPLFVYTVSTWECQQLSSDALGVSTAAFLNGGRGGQKKNKVNV